MSALIVHLGEHVAHLVTDTVVYNSFGAVGHGAKALTIPHLRCAVATRGVTSFLWAAADVLSRNPARDFDALRPCIRASLGRAIAMQRELHDTFASEAIVVGWSPRERRIVGVHFWAPTRECIDLERGWVAGPRELAEFTPPDWDREPVAASFVELAECQRAWAGKYAPDGHIGGDLVMTTVGESGIRQEIIHAWPDHRLESTPAPLSGPPDGLCAASVRSTARSVNRLVARSAWASSITLIALIALAAHPVSFARITGFSLASAPATKACATARNFAFSSSAAMTG